MARRAAPVGAPRVDPAVADRRERLERLRDRLAEAIDEAGNRDLAPLAARYQAVLAELAGMPAEVEGDEFDELNAHRAKRRSAATA